MCWCTLEIRTPNCGAINCHPPKPKIDWKKVWDGYKKKYPGSAIRQTNKNVIAEFVEKQLRGEE